MFECRAHDGIRTTFVERVEKIYPEFCNLSQDDAVKEDIAEFSGREIPIVDGGGHEGGIQNVGAGGVTPGSKARLNTNTEREYLRTSRCAQVPLAVRENLWVTMRKEKY